LRSKIVIFESPGNIHRLIILNYIKRGHRVHVIEPFCGYHYRNKIRFYPPPLPSYVLDLIDQGKLKLIYAREVYSRNIVLSAAEKAVEVVEHIYTAYKKDNQQMVNFLSNTIRSHDAEKIFKKNLCDRLGDFYSLNILSNRLIKALGNESITFYPNINIQFYSYYKNLIMNSNQHIYNDENIHFPHLLRITDRIFQIIKNLGTVTKIFAQTVGALAGFSHQFPSSDDRKKYRFAISIIAPRRQFGNNQRGPDFLIDENKIRSEEVVYIPLVELNTGQRRELTKLKSEVFYLPKIGRFFSNAREWIQFFFLSIRNLLHNYDCIIEITATVLFNTFLWNDVLKYLSFDHFVTHADFSLTNVARNIVFNKQGIKTWYFTDATNFGHNFRISDDCWNRHPFWTYLHYDNYITWHDDLAKFFSMHPQSFKNTHVVGCLWSQHAMSKVNKKNVLSKFFKINDIGNKFLIVAYSSTYTVNSTTSYTEGIQFAEDLLRLAEELKNIFIILKDKKQRSIHLKLEPLLGSKLIHFYENMERHPRIRIYGQQVDASLAMAIADMSISFPFTSTGLEALSINKPAIWHDPLAYYHNTPYANNGGLV
jgi:polysaccharide biosynthesis PFTS motif protein